MGMGTAFELSEGPVIPCATHRRPGLAAQPGEPRRHPLGCHPSAQERPRHLHGGNLDEFLDTSVVRQ
jgi:hypothetical protein